MKNGFSVLEVIIAVAIFMIFATGAIMTVAQSYNANRLGAENTIATQFAAEGIESVKSIKNRAYTNLTNFNAAGLQKNSIGNYWEFKGEGTSNTLEKYIRSIKVEDVNRDIGGNIVASGGTLDPDTKKITSTVTWNFNTARPETTSLITYLSDWRKPITTTGNGMIVYGDGTTAPKFRTYDSNSNTFGASSTTTEGASGVSFAMRMSPTKLEAIAGYITNTGVLQVMCFNGSSWSNEWSINVGGTGTTRRFDISYETNSGDVMVVYSRNAASANALAYNTKSGSSGCGSTNWTGATNFSATPSATTGTIQWVRMARDPRAGSNSITAIWADSNSDLGVNNWSGNAWATGTGTYKALETNLERVAASQDVDSFEVAYESVSGEPMVVWGISTGANGTNGARYSTCTGGSYTCSWSAVASIPTVSDDIHNIDMTANPSTNQIVYAAIGAAGSDLTAAYWSGSAWTGYANLDTSAETPFAGSKKVSTAWLINGATTRWILNYDDSTGTGLGWYAATPGSAPAKQTDFNTTPAINDIRERYDADMDPVNKEQAIVTLTDNTRSIFSKRVLMSSSGVFTWTNADGGASLGTIPSIPQQGFSFMYWRNQ